MVAVHVSLGVLVAATMVELFEQVRRDSRRGGLSVRVLAAKYGVHPGLVREALTRAESAVRKVPERRLARLARWSP